MGIGTVEAVDRTKHVLARHPVRFAMAFGSAARDGAGRANDLDIAVEFEGTAREDGYSDAYLGLVADLEAALDVDVDVVPVSSMGPRFAAVAFDEGVVLVGTEARKEVLARAVAGDLPTTAESRERVAAAAARLTE